MGGLDLRKRRESRASKILGGGEAREMGGRKEEVDVE